MRKPVFLLAVLLAPAGTRAVTIRARDSAHEYGGKEFKVTLP